MIMNKDVHGSTPLHLALWPDVDPDIVRLMIDACPEVAARKDLELEGL